VANRITHPPDHILLSMRSAAAASVAAALADADRSPTHRQRWLTAQLCVDQPANMQRASRATALASSTAGRQAPARRRLSSSGQLGNRYICIPPAKGLIRLMTVAWHAPWAVPLPHRL